MAEIFGFVLGTVDNDSKAMTMERIACKVRRNFILDKNTMYAGCASYIFGKAIAGALYKGEFFLYA